MHHRAWIVTGCLLALSGLAAGAVQTAEDLTGCQLPNGRAVLPVLGTPQASGGTLFKISSGTQNIYPVSQDPKPPTPEQMLARIQSEKIADLQYLPDGRGSLWAFSGFISEVIGATSLSDTSGKQLEPPGAIPKTSKNFAGQMSDLREGGIYLVKTLEGRFALLRIMEITKTAMVIQYVYQPAGGTSFIIPNNPRVPYMSLAQTAAPTTTPATSASETPPRGSNVASVSPLSAGPVNPLFSPPVEAPPAEALAAPTPPPAPRPMTVLPPAPKTPMGPGDINDPTLRIIRIVDSPATGAIAGTPSMEPGLENFIQQRQNMIQRRIEIISAPARNNQEIERKAQAISEFSQLHADEPAVADALVNEIAFLNTRSSAKEFSPDALHPSLGALKRIGKPATAAVLRGLRKLDLEGAGEGIDSPTYKVGLLGMVVRSVEGNDVADFIFRREANQETDPKRKAVFEYLLNK